MQPAPSAIPVYWRAAGVKLLDAGSVSERLAAGQDGCDGLPRPSEQRRRRSAPYKRFAQLFEQ